MRSGRRSPIACVNGVSSRSAAIVDVAAEEPQRPVAQQRPGHEPGLGEDLEAVADPEHEPALAPRTPRRRA